MEMYNEMKNNVVFAFGKMKEAVNNEKGVSTIEWVGLAAVILALMFAVSAAMSGQGSGLAGTIVDKISQMIQSINS